MKTERDFILSSLIKQSRDILEEDIPSLTTPYWDVAEIIDLNIRNILSTVFNKNNNNEDSQLNSIREA